MKQENKEAIGFIVTAFIIISCLFLLMYSIFKMAEDSYTYHKLIIIDKGYYESGDGKYYNKGKYIVARQLNDSLRWVELDERDLWMSGNEDSIFYNSEVNDTIIIKAIVDDLEKRFFTKLKRGK